MLTKTGKNADIFIDILKPDCEGGRYGVSRQGNGESIQLQQSLPSFFATHGRSIF